MGEKAGLESFNGVKEMRIPQRVKENVSPYIKKKCREEN